MLGVRPVAKPQATQPALHTAFWKMAVQCKWFGSHFGQRKPYGLEVSDALGQGQHFAILLECVADFGCDKSRAALVIGKMSEHTLGARSGRRVDS
jgi:hypothetical protein